MLFFWLFSLSLYSERFWLNSEDKKLVEVTQTLAKTKFLTWKRVAKELNSLGIIKTAVQCRYRWHENADPNICKDPLKEWEKEFIIKRREESMDSYVEIAKDLSRERNIKALGTRRTYSQVKIFIQFKYGCYISKQLLLKIEFKSNSFNKEEQTLIDNMRKNEQTTFEIAKALMQKKENTEGKRKRKSSVDLRNPASKKQRLETEDTTTSNTFNISLPPQTPNQAGQFFNDPFGLNDLNSEFDFEFDLDNHQINSPPQPPSQDIILFEDPLEAFLLDGTFNQNCYTIKEADF